MMRRKKRMMCREAMKNHTCNSCSVLLYCNLDIYSSQHHCSWPFIIAVYPIHDFMLLSKAVPFKLQIREHIANTYNCSKFFIALIVRNPNNNSTMHHHLFHIDIWITKLPWGYTTQKFCAISSNCRSQLLQHIVLACILKR